MRIRHGWEPRRIYIQQSTGVIINCILHAILRRRQISSNLLPTSIAELSALLFYRPSGITLSLPSGTDCLAGTVLFRIEVALSLLLPLSSACAFQPALRSYSLALVLLQCSLALALFLLYFRSYAFALHLYIRSLLLHF